MLIIPSISVVSDNVKKTPHLQEEEKMPYIQGSPFQLTHDIPRSKYWTKKYIIDKQPKYFINADILQRTY